MHSNAIVIERLFTSLDRHDHRAMADCYDENATFHDIAFDLNGRDGDSFHVAYDHETTFIQPSKKFTPMIAQDPPAWWTSTRSRDRPPRAQCHPVALFGFGTGASSNIAIVATGPPGPPWRSAAYRNSWRGACGSCGNGRLAGRYAISIIAIWADWRPIAPDNADD